MYGKINFLPNFSEKLKEKVEEYYPYLKEKCVVIPLSISHLDKNFTEIKVKSRMITFLPSTLQCPQESLYNT